MYSFTFSFLQHKKWLSLLLCLLLLVTLSFSLVYAFSGYEYLKDWYLQLNNCFYKSDSWSNSFFTPKVKAKGNLFAAGGIVISLAGLIYFSRKIRGKNKSAEAPIKLSLSKSDFIYLPLLLCFGLGLWAWGSYKVPPTFDEIFSAVKCAELPFFQTISYYMVPNNHLYFNALNGTAFFFSQDKVETGRVLSGVAYLMLIALVYFFSRQLTQSNFLAFLIAITVALQFPLWGFAVQARGYGIYALAHWLAFVSLLQYLKSRNENSLFLLSAAIITGLAMVPSFLYFYAALVSFAGLSQLFTRSFNFRFWKYQVLALGIVFLLYLPALGFSGLSAFIENKYVMPTEEPLRVFINNSLPTLESYVKYCFSNAKIAGKQINLYLFCLPVVLLFAPRRSAWFVSGCFYVVMIAAVLFFILFMKRLPFHRNLVGHFSIGLTVVILNIFWLISQLPTIVKPHLLKYLILPLLLMVFGRHLLRHNPVNESFNLYYYDAVARHNAYLAGVKMVPAGSRISFSDNSFFLFHLFRKAGFKTHWTCENSDTEFLILTVGELLPQHLKTTFSPEGKIEEYTILKKK